MKNGAKVPTWFSSHNPQSVYKRGTTINESNPEIDNTLLSDLENNEDSEMAVEELMPKESSLASVLAK